jgi:hypothetical protein
MQQQQKWGNIYLKSFSPGEHTPTHVDVVSIPLLTLGFLSERTTYSLAWLLSFLSLFLRTKYIYIIPNAFLFLFI